MWWIGAAVSVGSQLLGGAASKKAAKKAGKYNAQMIRAETTEQLRRSQVQFDQTMGNAVAGLGGSGVKGGSGSPNNYLGAMQREFSNQQDWTYKSGEMRAEGALRGANMQASQITANTIGNVAQTAGNAYTNSWWNNQAPSGKNTGVS